MKETIVVVAALIFSIAVALLCVMHSMIMFGIIAGVATFCWLLKLAEKVGWA